MTDGGAGDNDLSVNGALTDPGGPGVGSVTDIPTLSEWALLLLSILLGGLAWREQRRRGWFQGCDP